ncbi:MAG: hypothetical protein QM813_12770 [Verrucomicrobiota bacterium]
MTLPQPSRDEFITYWKDFGAPFQLQQLVPHFIYVGGLATFAVVVRLLSPPDRILGLCFGCGIAYAILFPALGIWLYQRKRVRFFRCSHCGAYFAKERHFEDVIETGRCACCRKQVLRDFVKD